MHKRWRGKRVGLALGSGGARGWAHLGVIEVLTEQGIEIECIAGTSMGAIVGSFLAAGRIEALRELADHLDWRRIRQFLWEISLSRSGLTDGRRFMEEAENMLGLNQFRSLKVPFSAVATDLDTGGEAVLNTGHLLQAIRASLSIPGLFAPVRIGRRLLVDGGLVNPVPVNVVRDMGAKTVISVDVSQHVGEEPKPSRPKKEPRAAPKKLTLPKPGKGEESEGPLQVLEHFFQEIESKVRDWKEAWESEAMPDMVEVLVRSVRIMEAQVALARRRLEPPDLLIEPQVGTIGTLDFQRAADAIAAGRTAAMAALT